METGFLFVRCLDAAEHLPMADEAPFVTIVSDPPASDMPIVDVAVDGSLSTPQIDSSDTPLDDVYTSD